MHVTIPFSYALPAIPKGAQRWRAVDMREPVTVEIAEISDAGAPAATPVRSRIGEMSQRKAGEAGDAPIEKHASLRRTRREWSPGVGDRMPASLAEFADASDSDRGRLFFENAAAQRRMRASTEAEAGRFAP